MRFLAVLELFKQGIIDIDQARSFGEIEISWIGADGADGEDDDVFGAIGRARAGAELDAVDLAAVDAYEG